jgi:superfamily II DNA or RNA helicase
MEFYGQPKDYQQDAAEAILDRDFATVVGGHKSGKTVIALYCIAQRCQPTLILIPRLSLMEGWLTKIENFLQIPASEVGFYIEGTHRLGKRLTIAHTGEMMRNWREVRNHVGHLVVDDCERCPSKVFTYLVPNFDTHYMLGLAGTAQRRDRLSRFIYYYVGDVVYSITDKDAREGRGIIQAHVVARPTEFDYPYRSRTDYPPMLQALMRDTERTSLIVDDIEAELREDPRPLIVLSGGEVQNQTLMEELKGRGIDAMTYEQPETVAEDFEAENPFTESSTALESSTLSEPMAILVTPQALTQCSRNLNSRVLFLAVPLYFKKQLAYAIRNLYPNGDGNGDRLKIYDYVDQRVSLLENYFRMRSYNYGVHPNSLLNLN